MTEFNIKKFLLIKKKIENPLWFTFQARSLLMKVNRIRSLPLRDSLFSIRDKYLKQKLHVEHSLSSTTEEIRMRSSGSLKEGEISCLGEKGTSVKAGYTASRTRRINRNSLGGQG